jgi:hypothetical protein
MKTKALLYSSVAILIIPLLLSVFTACRNYGGDFDIVYFFKTEPEKAVIDFLESLDNKDTLYIYNNLMLSEDRGKISREKFLEEFSVILEDISSIRIISTVYLGYENEMSKVVAEFDVTYQDGEIKNYKKYFYLIEENDIWKIILEKTFI